MCVKSSNVNELFLIFYCNDYEKFMALSYSNRIYSCLCNLNVSTTLG